MVLLARLLGPTAWGVFSAAMIPIMLALPLLDGTLGEGLIRRETLQPGHVDGAFWLGVGLGGVCLAAAMILAPPLAHLAGVPQAAALLPALALLPLLAAMATVPTALLQRDLRHGVTAAADAAAGLAAAAIALAGAVLGHGVWSLVAMELTRVAVRLAWTAVAARWWPGMAVRWHHLRELGGVNGVAFGTRLIQACDSAVPRAAILLTLGQAALGQFAIAWRLYDQVLSLLVGPLNALALPAAARGRAEPEALRRLLVGATRLSSLVAYPAFLGLCAIAPVLIPLAFGAEWLGAVLAVQILALLGVRGAVSSFNGGVLRGLGHGDWQLIVVAAGLGFIAIAAPLAAPYGVSAVAGAVTLRGFLTWPLGAWCIKRAIHLPVGAQLGVGMSALGASLAMALGVIGLDWAIGAQLSGPWRLALAVTAGGALYFAALLLISPRLARSLHGVRRALLARDNAGLSLALKSIL